MSQSGDYCAFEKAVEHLGDRWSLLIVRELAVRGQLGFNALVGGLPGISRSVLVRRLRKLEDFGLIARGPSDGLNARGGMSYRLAPAGHQLLPTLRSLADWADRWAPEDPAAARHDPDVIGFWLTLRVDTSSVPDAPAVLELIVETSAKAGWLVLQRGEPPSLCDADPALDPDRYVHVETDGDTLYALSRGELDWSVAISRRAVRLYGAPQLVRELPAWFLPATRARRLPVRTGTTRAAWPATAVAAFDADATAS